jgi:MFS family permease
MVKASIQLYRNAYSGLPREMWWLSFVMFINRSGTMVIPFLTVYITHKGYTLAEAGYVMGAFGAGSILGGFLGGRLTDKYGFYWVQVSSLFLNGLLFIILGQMESIFKIGLTIFVLSSLGEAFRPANAAAIAAYSTEENRTRCYSLNRLAINLGWAVGPAIGGILAGINYKLLFWVDGFTCIAASGLLLITLLPKDKGRAIVKDSKMGSSIYADKVFLK